jgi:hypothetical protein
VTRAKAQPEHSPFRVPSFLHALGGLVHRHREVWLRLGQLESTLLAEQLRNVTLRMPIYVAGLARSGSTLLHEVIAAHPDVATHRIKDYPMLFTPYWWRRATANLRPSPPRERAHRDGVMITTDSPDALEEMLWMAFFPRCHDPTVSNLMSFQDRHPAFEAFYDRHIRKLLLAECRPRYAAKANYHVARLPYLVRLYPDARIIIPVRAPADHIASLARQHRWFSDGQRRHPPALAYMRRSGHFEFGLDRRPVNLGDNDRVRRIVAAWSAGDEMRGLAMYWDMVHGYLARLLESDATVRAASLVVRYESLCAEPAATLRSVFNHCKLADANAVALREARRVRGPGQHEHPLSQEDLAAISDQTAATARVWGY